jgi:putative endonuclease
LKSGTTEKGRLAEDLALNFLKNEGLSVIVRNYRSPQGEIDLIMQDRDTTIFVEVRSRAGSKILDTIETIDQGKQNRIILTSQHYLQNAERGSTPYYRFDVILISGRSVKENIEWIKNAFDA